MALSKIEGIDWLVKEQANEDVIAAAVAASSALMSVATDAENITGTSDLVACTPGTMMAALASLAFPIASTSTVTALDTIATAALGTVRAVHGQIVASHAAIASGTVVGARGIVTISGVVSAGGAYFYGAQGKLVVTGTLNHADSRACALIAQIDATGGTLTSGMLSGVWIDALGVTGQPFEEFNAIRISSNKDLKYQSFIYAQSDAAYFTSLVKPTGGALSCVANAGTGDGSAGYSGGHEADAVLKILIADGTHNGIYYIPLFDQNT